MKKFFSSIIVSLILMSKICFGASLPPVEGKTYMAVSAQHYATEVGVDMLKKGGNAIDAAVAMGYALAVVHPSSGNIGGGGFMLIRFADGKTTFLNFREKAPRAIKAKMFLDKKGNVIPESLSGGHVSGMAKHPYLTVGVPGTVLGLNTALKKYGTMPLKKIIKPAILLARNGYKLLPSDVEILKSGEESFKTQPNVSTIFLKNGKAYKVGDTLIQKNLGATLEEIAREGSNAFYHGKIADAIALANQKNGGLITKRDLADYTVEELSPITCQYHGYTLITSPPPSSGGVIICEILNITEAYPLNEWGFHSAKTTHYILEAMRYAFADRNSLLGDPDFVKNPTEKLISKKYAKEIRARIKPNKATNSARIGFLATPEGHNTTSYVVLDKQGNAVSVTYTLNDYFGAKVIPLNTGFFLNNEIADFAIKAGTPNIYGLVQGNANLIAPEKRPLSSMSPTIITKDNHLFLVAGTPGGSTIPTQLTNFIQNVIDFGMNIQEAENASRFHHQWLPDFVYMEPFAFSKDTQEILEKMGYKFKLGSPYNTQYWGAITSLTIDPVTSKIYGAVDARRPAGAAIGN